VGENENWLARSTYSSLFGNEVGRQGGSEQARRKGGNNDRQLPKW